MSTHFESVRRPGSEARSAPMPHPGVAPVDHLDAAPGPVTPGADAPPARVNGIALHAAGAAPSAEELRQRACTELLRQAAQAAGLLDAADLPADDGVISDAATRAIEHLLDHALAVTEPSDDACRRHYEAQRASLAVGERLHLRHVLFAVTPGVEVQALRLRAEALLLSVRCAAPDSDVFAEAATQWSNCPTGAAGGDLGWLGREDCAPEFAREVFGHDGLGVLPQLVHSRFGLHVVEVRARQPGEVPAFERVRNGIAGTLRERSWVNALRQYLQVLADAATLDGIDLDAAPQAQ